MAVPARLSTDPHSSMCPPTATPRPYAGPTAASSAALELARGLLNATGAGPYVPAEWRRPDAAAARVAELTPSAPMAAVAAEAVTVAAVTVETVALEAKVVEPAEGESVSTDADELPWIDSFLASTPPLPMMAIEDVSVEEVPVAATPVAATPVAAIPTPAIEIAAIEEVELPAEQKDELTALAAGSEASALAGEPALTTDDTWPLDEATPDFERLSQQIDASHGPDVAATPVKGAQAVPARESDATTSPMSPWSDDEFMDIMPVRRALRTPMSSQAVDMSSQWAERARAAQVARDAAQDAGVGRASEAAEALEMLARRVRSGELAVPEFDGRNGESAALVAALAAVLGVRLR